MKRNTKNIAKLMPCRLIGKTFDLEGEERSI